MERMRACALPHQHAVRLLRHAPPLGVLTGPGVVGREYAWCRFPVMPVAPEPEAPEFVRERECEGEDGSGKLAGFV